MDKTLKEWEQLVSQPLSIVGWTAAWSPINMARLNKSQASRLKQKQFRSTEAQQIELLNVLGDASCTSIEGLRLRVQAWQTRPMVDVTATLELVRGHDSVCLSRVDMAPTSPHVNLHWRQFRVPPEITGSHHHPFDLNARLGRQAFAPNDNLPLAMPLESEPASFHEFAVLVQNVFGIDGVADLPRPAWNRSLPL